MTTCDHTDDWQESIVDEELWVLHSLVDKYLADVMANRADGEMWEFAGDLQMRFNAERDRRRRFIGCEG